MDWQRPLEKAMTDSFPDGTGAGPGRRVRIAAVCLFRALLVCSLASRGSSGIELLPAVSGEDAARPGPAPAAPAATPAPAAPEAIDRQPYRIELHLAFDPSARIDGARRTALLKEWLAQVRRFVGPPWIVTVAAQPSPLASGDLEALEPEAFARFHTSFDKIWLVRIASALTGSGLEFSGREYDAATRRLGPLQKHTAFVLADAPRALLQFALELFSPTALITGQEGGRALLLVRGGSILPASELGRVASRGMVFFPVRLITMRDQSIAVRRIAFSYLLVEEANGAVARCAIVSALRDPLTQRVARPNTLAAIGIKPGNNTLRLRFISRNDKSPAAGYTLYARTVPDGLPQDLGMTDRGGRIALRPGFAQGLVVLRLVAGTSEPLVEFPIMPGESGDEREIPIDPKPLSIAFQVQLDALRDEVIDLVAQRSRLEKRLEARLQGEDYDGVAEGLKEFALLPTRELFAERLNKLKDEATRQQAESRTPVLSKNLQAQFSELQALIDRYLENDAFQSYTEALERKSAERGGAPAGKKAAARKPASPTAPTAVTNAAAAPPDRPASAPAAPAAAPGSARKPAVPRKPASGAPPF